MTSNANWCQCDPTPPTVVALSPLPLSFSKHTHTLYYSRAALARAAGRSRKKRAKSESRPTSTSLLPNGSEKGSVFTAMANILVNTNLRGVWKMEGRLCKGGMVLESGKEFLGERVKERTRQSE